jgi:alkylhydroperoxidase/carboxymuconolactone decarboxylase family protein YurZ
MTSIGSGSFWQQDQNFWARSQQITQAQTLSSTVIDQMFGASSTLTTGLASIANQTALDRVNTALSSAVQGALNPGSTGSTASSSTSSAASSASSSSSAAAAPVVSAPATGTGTVPLTSGTPLLGLGFLTRGSFTVSDGTFTTTYQSTGTDTVGDLISAINSGTPGNALVHAWLNGSGNLVITSQNKNDTVTVSGDYAAALGFGSTNATFAPTKPPPISHPVVSSSTSATSGSASKSTATPASGIAANSALALQTGGTAELLLASSGSAGSIVNILA